MGNYASCFNTQGLDSKVAKLVDSQGQVSLLNLPITVAEVMLENPGFALSPVDELRQTQRIPAMRADDMLFAQKVYLLVPVDKVNSRLTDLQLAAIDSVVCSCNEKARKRTRGGSKISPVIDSSLPSEDLEDLVKGLGVESSSSVISAQSKKLCKAWVPVLEPILEI